MPSRAFSALAKTFGRTKKALNPKNNNQIRPITNLINDLRNPNYINNNNNKCDVFINHRSIDTKRTVGGLLYHDLSRLGIRAFLDSKSMKPGDSLYDKIDAGIRSCKIGVAVFSPTYCHSKFCLHELALLMESNKRVIPIFCDVKPSELRVPTNLDNGTCSHSDLQRYTAALEEAKFIVGLTFDCAKGDWSEFLQSASEAIKRNLIEVEEEEENNNSLVPISLQI